MTTYIRILCFILLFYTFDVINGQKLDTVFSRPLDIPVALAATFAELRDDHLHSGIDYRTNGATGYKVYACGKGYISRILVSPYGYGNALYITHPNGYTTVYGHLDTFNDEITKYVKQQQYTMEQFAVNLFPDATLFPVKRGEIIALSGNTGSSAGPHLHFEVRDTKTEEPLNPLMFGFGVKDNVPPILRQLAVYPLGEGSTVNGQTDKLILELEKSGNKYRFKEDIKLNVTGRVAFGIDAYDQVSGSTNRCGTYKICLYIDNVRMFSQTMDRFSFDESRYINSLIDYGYYVNSKVRFNRMYIEPNNKISVYDMYFNNGVVSFPDSANHKALVEVKDFHGNKSQLEFSFDYSPDKTVLLTHTPNYFDNTKFPLLFEGMYKREFIHTQEGIRIVIPPDALYDDIDFTCTVSPSIPKGLYSKAYKIHNSNTPLHKAMTIEISADNLPERLREKALIVQIKDKERRSNTGGDYRNGAVSATSRVFGEFAIGVDTVPPRITPVNIKNGANMSDAKNISFKITDNLSGISTYSGWIDGQWALFEYDAKNSLLFYRFDADRLKKNTHHTLNMKVTDSKGNTATFQASFTW